MCTVNATRERGRVCRPCPSGDESLSGTFNGESRAKVLSRPYALWCVSLYVLSNVVGDMTKWTDCLKLIKAACKERDRQKSENTNWQWKTMQCVLPTLLSWASQCRGAFVCSPNTDIMMMMIMMLLTGTKVEQEKGRECGYSLYFISLQWYPVEQPYPIELNGTEGHRLLWMASRVLECRTNRKHWNLFYNIIIIVSSFPYHNLNYHPPPSPLHNQHVPLQHTEE